MEEVISRSHERRHKWSRMRAPSSGWRQRLVQNCMARMKAERGAAVISSRAQRYAILSQEAASLRDIDRMPPELTTANVNELIGELEEALEAERQEMEQRVLREEQMALAEQDADVRELLQFHRRFGEGAAEGEVLCPVCSAHCLEVRDGIVGCSCGLKLEAYDNLTLEAVRETLLSAIEEHADGRCLSRSTPRFSCKQRFGFSFIHAFCDTCDLDRIVL